MQLKLIHKVLILVNENYKKIDSGIQTLDEGVSTLKNGKFN